MIYELMTAVLGGAKFEIKCCDKSFGIGVLVRGIEYGPLIVILSFNMGFN